MSLSLSLIWPIKDDRRKLRENSKVKSKKKEMRCWKSVRFLNDKCPIPVLLLDLTINVYFSFSCLGFVIAHAECHHRTFLPEWILISHFFSSYRNLHRMLPSQRQRSSPGRDHALRPAQNDQFFVSRHLLGKVMRSQRAPVKGPQKARCVSKCFGSQSSPWMPPVFWAIAESQVAGWQ